MVQIEPSSTFLLLLLLLLLLLSHCTFAAILTSFNRNFRSRNDGNRLTMNFLASPTIVTAMAFSGKLSFNPATDSIPLPSGESFRFSPPIGTDLPPAGFAPGDTSFYPSPVPEPHPETEVVIKKDSQRLELLEPFESPFGPDSGNSRGLELPPLKVLMRVRGKCTTDHISAAGPWLKYKGHLTNISENLRESLIGLTRLYLLNHNVQS